MKTLKSLFLILATLVGVYLLYKIWQSMQAPKSGVPSGAAPTPFQTLAESKNPILAAVGGGLDGALVGADAGLKAGLPFGAEASLAGSAVAAVSNEASSVWSTIKSWFGFPSDPVVFTGPSAAYLAQQAAFDQDATDIFGFNPADLTFTGADTTSTAIVRGAGAGGTW
jgi:hypothetical protein